MAKEIAVGENAVGVFAGFVQSLVSNQTISADVGAAINAALTHRSAEVEGAVAAVAALAAGKARQLKTKE